MPPLSRWRMVASTPCSPYSKEWLLAQESKLSPSHFISGTSDGSVVMNVPRPMRLIAGEPSSPWRTVLSRLPKHASAPRNSFTRAKYCGSSKIDNRRVNIESPVSAMVKLPFSESYCMLLLGYDFHHEKDTKCTKLGNYFAESFVSATGRISLGPIRPDPSGQQSRSQALYLS